MTDQFQFDNPIIPGSIWDKNHDFMVPVVSPVGAGPKGDKGDTAYFDDLTPQQLQKIYQEASFVGNKSFDEVVTTTGASTTTIPIPWVDYDQFDMLFIDVNGLDLSEHDDYEIVSGNIVLTTPLPAGQDVHFRLLRYDVVDGDKNIMNTMGRKDYNTVAEMKADMDLEIGDICHTLGFLTPDDGKASWYVVKAHGVPDGSNIVELDNDYRAYAFNAYRELDTMLLNLLDLGYYQVDSEKIATLTGFDVSKFYTQSCKFVGSNLWVFIVPRSGIVADPMLVCYAVSGTGSDISFSYVKSVAITVPDYKSHANALSYYAPLNSLVFPYANKKGIVLYDIVNDSFRGIPFSGSEGYSGIGFTPNNTMYAFPSGSRSYYIGDTSNNVVAVNSYINMFDVGRATLGDFCDKNGYIYHIVFDRHFSSTGDTTLIQLTSLSNGAHPYIARVSGIQEEPEGIDWFNDDLFIVTANGSVYLVNDVPADVLSERTLYNRHPCMQNYAITKMFDTSMTSKLGLVPIVPMSQATMNFLSGFPFKVNLGNNSFIECFDRMPSGMQFDRTDSSGVNFKVSLAFVDDCLRFDDLTIGQYQRSFSTSLTYDQYLAELVDFASTVTVSGNTYIRVIQCGECAYDDWRMMAFDMNP